MKIRTLIILLSISVLITSCTRKPKNAEDIIRMMKKKYNNEWYTHMTFSQRVNSYENDSIIEQTVWHEAYSFPNQLVLKFGSFDSGTGLIFNQDTMYYMVDNKIASKQKKIHDVILLGFDAYGQDVDVTMKKIVELKYDINKIHETVVDGRPAYCIGASNESEKKLNRFYIDKEHLYFLKYIKDFDGIAGEMHFNNYKKIEGKWVATKILFIDDGVIAMDEEYFNIQFPENIDPSIYQHQNFEKSIW